MSYESQTILDTIKEINHVYYLPSIQRKFVWEKEQIENLFDSLMRGYPIGTFLFWSIEKGGDPSHIDEYTFYEFISNYNEKDTLEFMQTKLEKPSCKDRLIAVLDGQQRLSSLYCALRGSYASKVGKRISPDNPYPKQELYFNLLYKPKSEMDNRHQFKFLIDSQAGIKDSNNYWLKVKDVISWANSQEGKLEVKKKLRLITKDIKAGNYADLREEDYDEIECSVELLWDILVNQKLVTYYEIKKESLDDILDIFVRVNSAGTPLSKSDLVFSTVVANWEDGREKIENLLEILNSKGDKFKFDKDFVITLFLALMDFPQKFEVKTFTKNNVEKISNAWAEISNAICDTVDLLVDFGFSSENLTAQYIIIPVAYYLFKSAQRGASLSNDDKEVIRRFIISGMVKKIFSASVESGLTSILGKLKKPVSADSHEFELVHKDHFDYDSLKDLEFQNRTLKIEASDLDDIMGTKKGPISFMILSLLYPNLKLNEFKWHQDHIHPKSAFTKRQLKNHFMSKGLRIGDDAVKSWQESCNTLVNLQLLPGKQNQEKSNTPLKKWIEDTYPSVDERTRYCRDNYIDESVGFELENFDAYYQKRKANIRSKLIDIFNITITSEEDSKALEEQNAEMQVAITGDSNTIATAAAQILSASSEGLTLEEIYEKITEQNLYQFKAEDPKTVLRVEIRRRCEGVEISKSYAKKWFRVVKEVDGRLFYGLINN